MSLLEMREVFAGYGGADILCGLDLEVEDGEVVVVVGPNGAGKSTAMKAVFGLARVREGEIRFAGHDITTAPSAEIVRLGICYVPQVDNVFPSLSVHENLEMGAFIRTDDHRAQFERVYDLFPALKDKRGRAAGSLSGGERQMVAIGRALMLEPSLLMLDEPTAALSPKLMEQIFEIVRTINGQGVSILMVEQNAKQSLAFADRGYVLVMGKNRHQDTGPNLLADRRVAEMFLGG